MRGNLATEQSRNISKKIAVPLTVERFQGRTAMAEGDDDVACSIPMYQPRISLLIQRYHSTYIITHATICNFTHPNNYVLTLPPQTTLLTSVLII